MVASVNQASFNQEMARAFDTSGLTSFRQEDLLLWNWQCAFFPGVQDWETWLCDVAAQMLTVPRIAKAQLTRSNLGDASEPVLTMPLGVETVAIGRDDDNHMVLSQPTVTRKHAEIRCVEDRLLLTDLGSSMGTLLNGARLDPLVAAELTPGAEFTIFPYRFTVMIEREWVPVADVRIHHGQQRICSDLEFVAGSAAQRTFAVKVDPSAQEIYFSADAQLLDRLTEQMLAPLESPSFVLAPSRDAWTELLVLAAMARANQDLAMPFRMSLHRAPPMESGRGIEYAGILELAGQRGGVRLFIPMAALAELKHTWTKGSVRSVADAASFRFAVSCGRIELTLRERNTLEAGDVILYALEPAVLFPGDDSRGWSADCHDANDGEKQVAIQERFDRSMHMTESDTQSHAAFQDLPLSVEIVLGYRELTLREAETLAPGSVLDLQRAASDPVRLAVNGRVIGTGELVDLDGRLGVRILDWSQQ